MRGGMQHDCRNHKQKSAKGEGSNLYNELRYQRLLRSSAQRSRRSRPPQYSDRRVEAPFRTVATDRKHEGAVHVTSQGIISAGLQGCLELSRGCNAPDNPALRRDHIQRGLTEFGKVARRGVLE